MNNLVVGLQNIVFSVKAHLPLVLGWLALLWGVQLLNYLSGYRLNALGIWPRKTRGLIGIIFAPFLHGGFDHLFFNSIPLFVLINLILLHGVVTFYFVSIVVIFLGGLAIWLFGGGGVHVGASGVIMGYFGFLFANAYKQPTIISLLLVILCLYYFGGAILLALFSAKRGTSWAGHFFGFASGIVAALLYAGLIAWS